MCCYVSLDNFVFQVDFSQEGCCPGCSFIRPNRDIIKNINFQQIRHNDHTAQATKECPSKENWISTFSSEPTGSIFIILYLMLIDKSKLNSFNIGKQEMQNTITCFPAMLYLSNKKSPLTPFEVVILFWRQKCLEQPTIPGTST